MPKVPTITRDPRLFAVGRDRVPPAAPVIAVPPLLLLPMRLEYRVVEPGPTVKILDTLAKIKELERLIKSIDGTSASAQKKRAEARKKFAFAQARSALPLVARSTGPKEIWFRWYPDESFAEKGIASVTPEETLFLSQFRAAIGARDWWRVDHAEVSAAWQAFAQAVGPYRAVYLLRPGSAGAQEGAVERTGRIAALPASVGVFALKGGQVRVLGEGAPIPPDTKAGVAYTASAIGTGGWISDFSKALALGMGMKLTDEEKVDHALVADWVIAVGLYGGKDATNEITALLRDQIANGEFEFLPQDAPTNNGPNELSIRTDPRTDLKGFVRQAAQEERNVIEAGAGLSAASQFGDVLGVDATVVRKAVRAGDSAFADAQAMLRVVGPALLNDVVENVPELSGVTRHEFIDVITQCVAARGTLPPIRAGRHAFGIATITDVGSWEPDKSKSVAPGAQRIHAFMAKYASWAREELPSVADKLMPVMQPGDADASEKLSGILQVERVSNRVDAADHAGAKTLPLGCPYVDGTTSSTKATSYLEKLLTEVLGKLDDPTSENHTWPLLYRLARLSLTGNITLTLVAARSGRKTYSLLAREGAGADELTKIAPALSQADMLSVTTAANLKRTAVPDWSEANAKEFNLVNGQFRDALIRLVGIANRPNGSAQLLTLMMEVLDLLQHRIDAWATGLAHVRLVTDRREGLRGLKAGYYGFLRTLRPKSATGGTDGFILAPSPAQATSAAVMRSAYLRHAANGAFAINLRSRRTRRALLVLEAMRKGTTLAEALGMRGERWLHDKHFDALIATLRDKFPVQNQEPPEGTSPKPVGRRVFDGLSFLDSDLASFTGADRTRAKELHNVLLGDLDAVSDLVMAEAAHQRAMGAAGPANAWLQVLSGAAVPGEPAFIRTKRYGQGSNYRVSVLLTEGTISSDDSPRGVAEPTLARLADSVLTGFSTAQMKANLTYVADDASSAVPSPSIDLVMNLHTLGMGPIDLVIGGRSELMSRFKHRIFERWLREPAISQGMGLGKSIGLEAWQQIKITIDLPRTDPATEHLLLKAEILQKAMQKGRPLEPADLNAAALPESALDEATEISLVSGAVKTLGERAKTLRSRLTSDKNALEAAHQDFMHALALAKDAILADPSSTALLQAETKCRALVDRLWIVSTWSEPSAIQPAELHAIVADTSGFDGRINALVDRLEDRIYVLNEAINRVTTNPRPEPRDLLASFVSAIRRVLDGDALPVLPPYLRVDALRPQVIPKTADPKVPLESWRKVRKGVQVALDLKALMPSALTYYVTAAATHDQPANETDARDETESPKVLHYGVMIGTEAQVRTSSTVLGVVLDEWVEQQPSATQMAAMAINYDSPQAEPPHCLLLCVPSSRTGPPWSAASAANMVVELIAWMKVRALSTREKPTPSSLLPGANQVAFKRVDGKDTYKSRIPGPQKAIALYSLEWYEREAQFLTAANTSEIVGPSALNDPLLKGSAKADE